MRLACQHFTYVKTFQSTLDRLYFLQSVHFDSMSMGQGATMALPIWAIFMKKVYADVSLGYSPEVKLVISTILLIGRKPMMFSLSCNHLGLFFTSQSVMLTQA